MFYNRMIVLVLLLSSFTFSACSQDEPLNAPRFGKAEGQLYRTDGTPYAAPLHLQVAATPEQRTHGLMFVKHLPPHEGMIFIWQEPTPVSMWMKNTFIPLDMLFLRAGRVVDMAENTIPHNLESVGGHLDVDAVLEVNAGYIRTYGVKVGDTLKLSLMP